MELRIVSYNVRSLRDDAQAVIRVLRALDPDVVCIQEVPRFFRWRARCARLARESGLLFTAGGRTTGGSALLSHQRIDVRSVSEIRLSKHAWLHQRGLAVAELRRGDVGFAAASVHLGLKPWEREQHATELLGHLKAFDPAYVVLAGDLNEPPGSPAVQLLTNTRFRDARTVAPYGGELTYSATDPVRRIDYVLVGPEIEVVRCGVPEGLPDLRVASDHLPVLADLRLG